MNASIKFVVERLTPEFFRYFGASLCALIVDTATLLALATMMHYTIAASVAFLIGTMVHYAISVRFVFAHRPLAHRRWFESSMFFLIGLCGLIINVSVITACVEWFAVPLLQAKLLAAGVSFLVAYAGRKLALFS